MASVNVVLLLIAWGVICALVAVLQRIARFYQITSGRRSHYQWFGVPLVLLAAAAVIDMLFAGESNVLGDVLLLMGGASLIGLGYNLLRMMTGSRS
jgi:hypothetical protein